MSDSIFVMLKEEKMPTPKEWADEIIKEGFGLTIDTTYDPSNEDVFGFRPCVFYDDDEVGYELDYVRKADDPEDFEEWSEEYPEVKDCDFSVILGIYGEDDVKAATVAAAVLAKMSGGVYFDVDSPVSTQEAYDLAKKADDEMKFRR